MEILRNSSSMEHLGVIASRSLNEKRTPKHLACYKNKTSNSHGHQLSSRCDFQPRSFALNHSLLKTEVEALTL